MADPAQTHDTTEADLLAAAMLHDAGEGIEPAGVEQGTQIDVQSGEAAKTDAAQSPADADAQAKAEAAEKEADAKPEGDDLEAKPTDSRYVKARKDAERLDRSWKKLEEEKSAVRAEADRLKTEATQRQQQPTRQEAAPFKDKAGFTAADYERAAAEFTEQGDGEMAKRAMVAAKQLAVAEQQAAQQGQAQQFQTEWQRHVNEAIAGEPDLGNKESALSKAVVSLLANEPLFSQTPDGIKKAVEVAKLRQQAGDAQGLREQVTKLTAEVARLNKLTALNGSNPNQPAKDKSFDDLTMAEQEKELQRMADQYDRSAA